MSEKYTITSDETNLKIPHDNLAYDDETDEVKNGKHGMANKETALEFSSQHVKGVLTSQPVTYTWENIEAEIDIVEGRCRKKQTTHKRILDHVTGAVQPGEFLAIMGASGAGKTTLLNCLTFRNTGKLKITGTRFLNGAPVNTDALARISGYVQQDDLFIGTLKVGEILRFQALLRMDKHFSYEERMERVEEVILELGLTKCRNTLVGNPEKGIKGISGGERKRLAFACELLTNPSLMFCDEPTSGLDSFMAQNIVQALKNLASAGKTVICTIHQPSSEVFAMFDRILLMAEGRTAFLGPIDDCLRFFSCHGMPCPANYNPADFYIFSLATVPGKEIESRSKIKYLCDAYDTSEAAKQVKEIVQKENNHSTRQNINDSENMKKSPYKANWFQQFSAVIWRSFLSVVRDPQILVVKASSSIFIALLIALIYQGQSMDASSSLNIQGVLFLFLTNATFENVFAVINTFSFELPIFLREHFNGMYRTDVYFLSKTFAELAIYIFFPFVAFAIPYYIIGLNPLVERFFIGAGIVILVTNVATSFGYFVSCVASTPQVALAISAPMIIPVLLFGGFFLQNGSVPVYLDWLRYLSWFMYGNEALSINQWYGVEFNNTDCQYVGYNVTEINELVPEGAPDEIVNFVEILTGLYTAYEKNVACSGEDILEIYNFKPEYFYRDIACLGGLILLFRLFAFFALLGKTYRK
ncbi:ATP-binding cassette sub-family G member 4 [Daphnia magna]|uniref:Protein white n=1 Tax=Daphnia magna TaxID=35525 RepID=A0A164K8Z6_9CRUS|nr:ATP-binding cassette sub-family G member 4 [Daphnia magna]